MKIQIIGHTQPYYYASVLHRIADALTDNGHTVIRTDRNNIIIDEQADFVLYIDCSEDFSAQMVDIDKPQVFWSFDAHMPDGAERSANIARKCDLVFATQKEHGVGLLAKFGIDAHLLPFTYSERLCIPQKEKEYDVVMIGHNNSPQRETLWNGLKQRYNCMVGEVSEADYIDGMGSAKIVINQPTEPWDIILTNRFFEGMGAGAMILNKRVHTSIAEDMGFKDGEHFVYWSEFDELWPLIDYYLKNDFGRQRIANNGHEFCKQYALRKQMEAFISIVLDKFKELRDGK